MCRLFQLILYSILADEREGNQDATIVKQDSASQLFLRNEIKTVGKDSEVIENIPEKRPHATSSPDPEIETKRRRLDGSFGKNTKESNLDMLQVLQEKNRTSNTLTPISPDFSRQSRGHKFTFSNSSASTPPPILSSNIQIKKDTKIEKNILKEKGLLSPPKPKTSILKQQSPLFEKASDKTQINVPKVPDGPSSAKRTPSNLPSPSIPEKPLQLKFSKPKAPKKEKVKDSPVENIVKIKEENMASPNPVISPPPLQDQLMPKLIIKPMKIEKSQISEYSISTPKRDENTAFNESANILTAVSPFVTDEVKSKKKKKKKVDTLPIQPSEHLQSSAIHTPLVDSHEIAGTSSGLFKATDVEMTGEVIKKKKKKHKEKDRDKSKPKKVNISNKSLIY